jgi:basic amino acid/polyamine antiporter, APA family
MCEALKVTTSMSTPSFLQTLIRKRPLPEASHESGGLKRTLNAKDLVVLGVSAMVGTGIFVLTGQAAADGAGPGLVVSILLTGVLCLFCALSYSELATLIPVSGSAYAYMFTALGEFVAWIVGWVLVVEYIAGNMTIAQGWGKTVVYTASLLNIDIPRWMNTSTTSVLEPGQAIPAGEQHLALLQKTFHIPGCSDPFVLVLNKSVDILPVLGLLVCAWLLARGVEENVKLATLMVYIKIAIILFFVAVGGYYLFTHPELLQMHWFKEGWVTFFPNGWDGVVKGAGLMFFAYVGFDALACSAEEAKNPQRDMPIGIVGSLIICTVLYVAVAAIVTALVPLNEIHRNASVVHSMSVMGIPYADIIVGIGEIVGISSVMLVMQMATIRVVYSIARDRLLPRFLEKVDPRLGVPIAATWVIGIIDAVGSGLLPISQLAQISSIGTLFVFMMVCLAVIILRFTMPNAHRPFKTPLGIALPLLGTLGCAYLMMSLSPVAGFWILVSMAVGLVIYFVFGRKNSIMNDEVSMLEAYHCDEKEAACDVG